MAANDGGKIGGGKRGPGRPPGSSNKITKDIREAILNAFNAVGGEAYLVNVANDDPKTFCTLLSKVLPMQVTGEGGGALTIQITRYGNDPTA